MAFFLFGFFHLDLAYVTDEVSEEGEPDPKGYSPFLVVGNHNLFIFLICFLFMILDITRLQAAICACLILPELLYFLIRAWIWYIEKGDTVCAFEG